MQNNTSCILIETIVRNALKNIEESPERSIRNLVDMALNFSEGRFQQHFLGIAQEMLKNERSPYYTLIKDIVDNVETERIVNFGMNLGYNSCTAGAKRIRLLEEEYKCNVPWIVFLKLGRNQMQDRYDTYENIISQGEALGIYTWALVFAGQMLEAAVLAQNHPDSVFFFFCDAEGGMLVLHDIISNVKNCMFVMGPGEDRVFVCEMLRRTGIPYSVYDKYGEKKVDEILNGNYIKEMEKLHPIFVGLIPEKSCSSQERKRVVSYTHDVRKRQIFQGIVVEILDVCQMVDHIISGDECVAFFDEEGQLYGEYEEINGSEYNLLENKLLDILKKAFPKSKKMVR